MNLKCQLHLYRKHSKISDKRQAKVRKTSKNHILNRKSRLQRLKKSIMSFNDESQWFLSISNNLTQIIAIIEFKLKIQTTFPQFKTFSITGAFSTYSHSKSKVIHLWIYSAQLCKSKASTAEKRIMSDEKSTIKIFKININEMKWNYGTASPLHKLESAKPTLQSVAIVGIHWLFL